MAKKPSARRPSQARPARKQKKQARSTGIWSVAIPVVVGVVVVAVIVAAIIFNENRRAAAASDLAAVEPNDLSVPVITVGPQPTQEIPFPDVPRMSLKDTQTQLQRGKAVLIDVRDKEAYDEAHAAGALSIPQSELAARLSELPRDKMLIFYCT